MSVKGTDWMVVGPRGKVKLPAHGAHLGLSGL